MDGKSTRDEKKFPHKVGDVYYSDKKFSTAQRATTLGLHVGTRTMEDLRIWDLAKVTTMRLSRMQKKLYI